MRFSEVIGLQQVKDRLRVAVKEGRISHAQLFSGQKGGVGLSMALAYATYLMCENKSDNDSCGVCKACLKNDKFIHPDLHFTFPVVTSKDGGEKALSVNFLDKWRSALLENPNLSVDEWYECLGSTGKQGFISAGETEYIIEKLNLKTFESRFKILLMWMPEKMFSVPANKLLKTLEEPLPGTVILFVTENSNDLLSTIQSRMQWVRIPLPSANELVGFLKNQYGLDHERAIRIVKIMGGNVSASINMAQISSDEETFSMELDFIHWMRLCFMPFYAKDGSYAWNDLMEWIEQTNKRGKEHTKRFLSFCIDAVRECMLLSVGAGSMARFDDSVIPGFGKFSRFIHGGNIEPIMELLGKASYAVERNANPRILLLDLSFKLNVLLNPKSS